MKPPVPSRLCWTLILAFVLFLAVTSQALAARPCAGFHNALDSALLAERNKNTAKAKACWIKVVEYAEPLLASEPENVGYLMGAARAFYALGDYVYAEQLWEEALDVLRRKGVPDPQDAYPWIYVYLGLCYAWQGNAAKAAEYWRQVPMSIGSVYTTIHDQLPALEAAGAAQEAK